MTTSAEIRRLAAEGMATADIARQLGIRYQFAYGVLGRNGPLPDRSAAAVKQIFEKPALHVERLTTAGFQLAAVWIAGEQGRVALSEKLPKAPGVYAFAIGGIVQYVGLASMGLAKRTYFYARPGSTQRTSLRLNAMLVDHVAAGTLVEIYIAMPDDGEWHGLPVDNCAGLELGLIRTFGLPWNMRSSG